MRPGRTSVILTASKFVGSALGFFTTVYFAQVLGESVLGQYALVLSLVTWVAVIGKAGLSKAIIKRLSEGNERAAFLGAGIVVVGAFFLVASGVVFLFKPLVNRYVGADTAEFVIVILFVNIFGMIVTAALQGTDRVYVTGIISTIERLIRAVGQVMLVVLGFGITGLLLGHALSGLMAHVIGALYVRLRPSLPSRQNLASLFDFAKYAWLGNISDRAYSSLDILVLGLFVSSGLVGIYSVAWSVAIFLNIFGSSLEGTLFPEMSRKASDEGAESVRELTEEALRYAGVFTIPGLVGAAIIGDRLLAVYGQSFVRGEAVLVMLIGAALMYIYLRQFRNSLSGIDRPDLAFKVNGVFTAVNLLLNVGLVAAFGWLGAAVATLCSVCVGTALAYRYVRLTIGIELPLGSVGRQWVAALVMGVFVFVGRGLAESAGLGPNSLLVVVLVGGGAAIYLGVLVGIWPGFRITLRENMPAAPGR